MNRHFMTFNKIIINGHEFGGDAVMGGTVHHDINEGTVTLTLVDVHTVEVLYTGMSTGEVDG